MLKLRSAAVALVAIAALSTAAYTAGYFPGFPVVGGQSYCSSVSGTGTGTGSSTFPSGAQGGTPFGQGAAGQVGTFANPCNVTVPAGPAFTGEEMFAADTGLPSGQNPQTVLMPNALAGSLNTKRNRIIGGDFATNLWQRGTTPVNAASPSTATMAADRFYAYSAAGQMTVTKQTGVADSIPSFGMYASMRVQRPAAQTGLSPLCVGQILDKLQSQDFIGRNAIMSFQALAGANFSPSSSNLTVTVAYYTAADSATPGTNTGTFATGTITGYQAAVLGVSGTTVGSVASGVATVPISTTWTNYSVYAPIPTVNAAGTAVTGVGISICNTPVGTAGAADWVELEAVSLNAAPSLATPTLPNGVTSPIGFERRPPAEEAALQYYYTSPAGLGTEIAQNFYQAGICRASGNANFPLTFNPPLRAVPTTATSTLTAGGYSIQTAAAITAIGTMTISGASVSAATLNSTAACTSTLPYNIVGSLTTGLLLFSAEP